MSTPTDLRELSFVPELVNLLRERNAVGRSGRVFTGLAALSSVNNLVTLRRLMVSLRPERTLEIGLAFGGSGLVFAGSHRDLGRQPIRQHLAIDPLQHSVWDDCGLQSIERAGLSEHLDFRSTPSALELPRLLSEGVSIDLAYVDGSHLVENVFVDAYFATRMLSQNGVIAFDDSPDAHVQKVLRFVRSNCRRGLEEFDLSPYRLDGGAGARYRLARLIGKVQMTAFRRVGPVERDWNAAFRDF